MKIPVNWLKDQNGEKMYPVAHIKSVISDDGTLDKIINKKVESEEAIDFTDAKKPEFVEDLDGLKEDMAKIQQDYIKLELLLLDIKRIIEGGEVDKPTLAQIDEMIVEFFESKLVKEIDANETNI